MAENIWTNAQFDEMSWHDNHVHGLSITEGANGAGELILDLDYILEWIKAEAGFQFRILPVTLRFREVTALRISLDYATPTAALGPFSIHVIEQKVERRDRYDARLWKLILNWPVGEITFESSGFEQRGVGVSKISNKQCLKPDDRELRA